MYDVQTYRYLLILHHDKLKLRWACEQPKWIRDYQASLRVITEPTGTETGATGKKRQAWRRVSGTQDR